MSYIESCRIGGIAQGGLEGDRYFPLLYHTGEFLLLNNKTKKTRKLFERSAPVAHILYRELCMAHVATD